MLYKPTGTSKRTPPRDRDMFSQQCGKTPGVQVAVGSTRQADRSLGNPRRLPGGGGSPPPQHTHTLLGGVWSSIMCGM